ncbi:hypothetical protein CANCADRAFT_696 [Tortispora caseinolytica NRRL Y-17796]|uniref:HTH TFE/IIEalpha-type domain-containing protein n=1 Tax=Tortispora caseinolytica NRRL Y-17796 TaxID=767744 RepID=A0A1E4TK45_9ASCO|nr:hypothetical protein CANCADRAFT_696 [Tortispora caseinolytica NRRL Y-17796]
MEKMDIIDRLLRAVVRMFYDTKHVLIMEAIIIHKVLTDDELAKLLGIQRKEIRLLCAKLREDRLLSEMVKKEEGTMHRPIQKTFYYIRYTHAVDSIKWHMSVIENKTKEEMMNQVNSQGFICPMCNSRFSPLEAMSNASPDMSAFLCANCGNQLQEEKQSKSAQLGQEKLGKLMDQVSFIINSLMKIDEMLVPDNSFESTLANAVPLQETVLHQAYHRKSSRTAGGLDMTSVPKTQFHVDITTNEQTEEAIRLENERKKQLAQQNALPVWHSTSAVSNAAVSATSYSNADLAGGINSEATESELLTARTAEPNKETKDAIAEYYANLQAAQSADEDEDEEDDEDDEFEELELPKPELSRDTKPNENNDDDEDSDEDGFEDLA